MTEAETIAALAVQANDDVTVVPHTLGDDVLVVDRDLTTYDFEHLRDEPRRARGVVDVQAEASFVEAVNRWGSAERAVVYVDTSKLSMVAVLNDVSPHTVDDENTATVIPGPVAPGWRDHRVAYDVPLSETIAPWVKWSGELMPQADFAQFIEENMGAIASPAGRDLYAMATTLEGHVDARWRHRTRDTDGTRTFEYSEEGSAVATTDAGQVEIPPTFTLAVPVFEGGELREIEAKLRYRLPGGALALGFVLTGFDAIVRDEFQAVIERVHGALDADACTTVLLAKAPAPAQAAATVVTSV